MALSTPQKEVLRKLASGKTLEMWDTHFGKPFFKGERNSVRPNTLNSLEDAGYINSSSKHTSHGSIRTYYITSKGKAALK